MPITVNVNLIKSILRNELERKGKILRVNSYIISGNVGSRDGERDVDGGDIDRKI